MGNAPEAVARSRILPPGPDPAGNVPPMQAQLECRCRPVASGSKDLFRVAQRSPSLPAWRSRHPATVAGAVSDSPSPRMSGRDPGVPYRGMGHRCSCPVSSHRHALGMTADGDQESPSAVAANLLTAKDHRLPTLQMPRIPGKRVRNSLLILSPRSGGWMSGDRARHYRYPPSTTRTGTPSPGSAPVCHSYMPAGRRHDPTGIWLQSGRVRTRGLKPRASHRPQTQNAVGDLSRPSAGNIQGRSNVCNLHDVGLCCNPRWRWHSPVTAGDGLHPPLVAYVGWDPL